MRIKKIIPKSIKKFLKRIFTIQIDTRAIYNVPQSVTKKQFSGKVALVTGGAGGIGSAICMRLALEGATVFVCGRTKSKLESVCKTIKEMGGEAYPLEIDVTDYNSVQKSISEVFVKQGQIDLLVNCAGGSAREKSKLFINQDVYVIEDIINTNLYGTINVCRAIAPDMAKRKTGCIINISSIIGLGGKRLCCDYAAAKAGIIGFTKSLAIEMGEYNIRVNSVLPGKITRGIMNETILDSDSKCNYLGIPGTPEDIAGTVSFLFSEDARFITGQTICVDGGRTLGLHGD